MSTERYGREVYKLKHGAWIPVSIPRNPQSGSFLIVCDYGDWSGFRTLEKCLAQIPSSWSRYPVGFYRIVER
jgi:hypothetical protein